MGGLDLLMLHIAMSICPAWAINTATVGCINVDVLRLSAPRNLHCMWDLTREFFLLPSHVYVVAEEFSNGLEVHYIWLTRLHGASSNPNHPKLITSRFLPVILSAELVSKSPYVCLGQVLVQRDSCTWEPTDEPQCSSSTFLKKKMKKKVHFYHPC